MEPKKSKNTKEKTAFLPSVCVKKCLNHIPGLNKNVVHRYWSKPDIWAFFAPLRVSRWAALLCAILALGAQPPPHRARNGQKTVKNVTKQRRGKLLKSNILDKFGYLFATAARNLHVYAYSCISSVNFALKVPKYHQKPQNDRINTQKWAKNDPKRCQNDPKGHHRQQAGGGVRGRLKCTCRA